ncbi:MULTISPECIES: TIGR02444 family protein [Corallincola]|uniref:TIGR02444 family protein n=3 Tax=Corallincola TaxID=1775176 RepID=A0A368MZV7_9GAMM|nr:MULTISPECIES: TIGR02444 family protein [Corallincola]RCU43782.1 TIGR02444 family protein [Corallincola holothuriorum]TAA46897.1 TIGR02444 family protein [Corallincola spongiicola]TCI04545.1 TIGR02444 family protein [Corallincola luteus]
MELEADSFWQASYSHYQQPDVKDACLWLQDEKGLNVNLLLLICWAAEQGIELTPVEIDTMLTAAAEWHEQNIAMIRQLRRATEAATWMDDDKREQLKQKLLDSELTMERIEQQILVEQLKRLAPAQRNNARAEQSFWNYLLHLNIPLDEEIQAKFGQLL